MVFLKEYETLYTKAKEDFVAVIQDDIKDTDEYIILLEKLNLFVKKTISKKED